MGVFEERSAQQPAMHWQQQQHDRYIGPAYDPSRDLSPNLPSCESSMGDADVGLSASSSNTSTSSSACSTPSNNNNHHQSTTCPSSCAVVASLHHDNQHHSHHHHLPKLEPLPAPNTPPTPTSGAINHLNSAVPDSDAHSALCAGCGMRIADRFYLQAVDRRWHAACLQCCQCRNTLDGEITCFSREGNIYCKKDYYRLFGMKRCGRCQAAILSSELVMRAREFVFHVHCFSCAVCNCPLTKGDHFGMRDGAVLCRLHFEMSLGGDLTIPLSAQNSNLSSMNSNVGIAAPAGPYHHPHPVAAAQGHYPPPFPSPEFHPGHLPPPTPIDNHPPPGKMPPFFNGAPTTPRQKGRPRKRKPKDLESMTANIDLNSDYLDMPFGRSPGTPGMGSNQRTKRMRTSFKHHQLRTMKSYFAINHNPDAKDLKQLSQKTGLPKRVLQVWFQNARAKWRRMMLKQEGKSGEKCSGSDGGLGDLDVYPHGPGSMTGSCPSLPPRSPQFMLPPGSPSSLDCA